MLSFIADPDYGDITDPMTGRDISVEFKTAEETGANFPSTSIRVKPNQTPITEDAKQLKGMIENQVEITSIYTEQSYDELKEVLDNYLSPEEEVATTTTESKPEPVLEGVTKTSDVDSAFDDLFNS